MLDPDANKRATIADVIRQPYFMDIHETEAFALALHGGLFKSLVSTEQFDQDALKPMSVGGENKSELDDVVRWRRA